MDPHLIEAFAALLAAAGAIGGRITTLRARRRRLDPMDAKALEALDDLIRRLDRRLAGIARRVAALEKGDDPPGKAVATRRRSPNPKAPRSRVSRKGS